MLLYEAPLSPEISKLVKIQQNYERKRASEEMSGKVKEMESTSAQKKER